MSAEDLARTLGAIAEELAAFEPQSPEEAGQLRSAAKRLSRVVELLVARGVLSSRDARLIDCLGDSATKSVVRLAVVRDKREVPSPPIDCAKYLHLCHARCCSLRVTLAPDDVRVDHLRFELDDPYVLERGADGYCVYHSLDGCTCYHDRPAICREYDCREDKRVWLDFEQQLPAPMPANVRAKF